MPGLSQSRIILFYPRTIQLRGTERRFARKRKKTQVPPTTPGFRPRNLLFIQRENRGLSLAAGHSRVNAAPAGVYIQGFKMHEVF